MLLLFYCYHCCCYKVISLIIYFIFYVLIQTKINKNKNNSHYQSFIATHHHWDHVGGEVSGVRIPGLREWLDDGLDIHVPVQEKQIIAEQTDVDASRLQVFEDGQCMSIGKYGVEFIHTPGHSPGSMCIRVTTEVGEDKQIADILLITGDTVFPVIRDRERVKEISPHNDPPPHTHSQICGPYSNNEKTFNI
jgi:hypothetical protein